MERLLPIININDTICTIEKYKLLFCQEVVNKLISLKKFL